MRVVRQCLRRDAPEGKENTVSNLIIEAGLIPMHGNLFGSFRAANAGLRISPLYMRIGPGLELVGRVLARAPSPRPHHKQPVVVVAVTIVIDAPRGENRGRLHSASRAGHP